MPANAFHVAVYLQCLIFKRILLLLYLMLFTVLTGLNAWLVCRGFLTLSFLPWIVQDRPISWRGVCCNRVVESRRRFSDTLLPQRLFLMRICRGLELYRLLDLLPESGVKTRATAEPGRSSRTLVRTYQTFPVYVFSLRAGGATAAANTGINYDILRANACKYRATGGQSQNLKFLHTLPIDKYQQVAKRDVVCFSKDRLNLEKIGKFNFHCRRLQNNQNLRRNEPFSKLRPYAKGKKVR